MSKLKVLATCIFVAGVLALIVASPALAATTSSHAVYSFDLTTPNTATSLTGGDMMVSPGDWISVTGSGTFDTAAKTVKASGKFVHNNGDGSVHCRGTWKATAFTSFDDFGTNSQGQEGGKLSLVVTHYCTTMGMTMTGIPMTVTSTVKTPVGSGSVEGITVGPFTKSKGGSVVMQPEQ